MLRRAALALVVAGCYGPAIPNGAQQCAPGGVCADGYQCAADNRCYRVGELPGDAGARDLSVGDFAGTGGDRAGVDQAHAPDLVMPCSGDTDCSGATPRCDPATRLCAACLPTNDNCSAGYFCTMVNGSWACQQGCKLDSDCTVDGGLVKCCANRCVDVDSDSANCGACATSCAGKSCCTGLCKDLTSDVANCGACGAACAGKNATWTCTAQVCTVASCTSPFVDCNMQSGDGCEVNDGTDPANCGACGRACSASHVTPACGGGSCNGACAAGFADCNGNKQTDGCETGTASDPNHCGGCTTVCSSNHVTASCGGGACNGACAGGFADCNGNKQTDGCETQVNGNDPSNCGGCGTVCSANHVTPQCSGGACVGGCAGGYADCNGNKQVDGCEINLTIDANHCGACANICSSNHVTPTCGNSVCNGVCQAGFADCNGSKLTDGCETAILSDPANCGGCGVTCGMLQTCQGGGCVGQVLAGSYDVNSGPVWNTNPPTYTCLEACVVKFGAGSYSCSTVSTSVNHLAWVSGYASTVHCAFVGTSPVSESYKLNATYDCGAAACSYSAYVQDVCSEGMPASINYCFR